ncbi:meiotic recombination protein REC8 homolog [Lampetra fluviatilis]
MFYYPEVLRRRGKFATIWLAATKAVKLSRREWLLVNVNLSCNDVLDHVMLRVKEKGQLRRFSLYLSAQLMYGLACVFSRQSGYLIDDVRSCLEKLHRAATVARIDMEETERLRLTLPDELSIMEETLGAADPWFGVMTFLTRASETLHPIEFQAEVLSPLPPSGSPLSPEPPFTMRDLKSLVPEEGMFAEQADLPELSPQEIQHLLSPHLLSPLAPHGAVEEEEEEVLRKDGTYEDSGVTQHPSGISLEADVEVTKRRTVDDIRAAPLAASPDALEATLTGAVAPAMPSPPSPLRRADDSLDSPFHLPPLSPEGAAPPPYRRRRRHRLFSDDDTQMPQDEMRAQVAGPQRSLQPFVPIEPESIQRNSVSHLFRNPASGWLMPPLRGLWDRAAVPPASARRRAPAPSVSPSSVCSETEVVRAQVERSTLLGITGEGIESADGESITAAEIDKFPSALVHEVAMDEVGMEEVEAAVEAASPEAAIFPAVPSRSPTPPARLASPLQEAAAAAAAAATRNRLLQRIEELTRETGDALMSLLIPRDRTTRGTAARVFYLCLELAGHRIIALEQTQPFGAIRITRGPDFTSGL